MIDDNVTGLSDMRKSTESVSVFIMAFNKRASDACTRLASAGFAFQRYPAFILVYILYSVSESSSHELFGAITVPRHHANLSEAYNPLYGVPQLLVLLPFFMQCFSDVSVYTSATRAISSDGFIDLCQSNMLAHAYVPLWSH